MVRKIIPVDPLEEEITNFFEELIAKVNNGDAAGVVMNSVADSIAGFIFLKFERTGQLGISRAFCRAVMENVEVLVNHKK